ncbi:lipopolysaccharide biosynthesis protein [Sedimenticola hydrogenitrophicus]|uniref:lipopolysaccharide biosynthesis protein n=1 Tax=Sedimenticola hydrogenitrophicus TaxID=2967975 RepID=UPI0023AFFF59|nr:lipopolysaccharide biosynthesis protein [Sedimenticola hydrogenitrophicus]
MTSIRNSLAVSFLDKYSSLVLQTLSTLILARLLTPEEIGIYSLGAVIIGFAQMLRDFGVSNYLVQEKDLTRERIRTAFGVTLLIAWSAATLLLIFSDSLATLYDKPEVSTVIWILTISLFFIPINSTVLGLLRRNLDFKTIFHINISSAISHAVTGVFLAYNDFGFASLAWASVASAATTLLVGLLKRPDDSEFIPSLKEFKRIFSFGAYASSSSLLSEAGLSAPDLTISHNLGFSFLGYYSRAVGLVSIFNYTVSAAINPVILPAFSNSLRENRPIKQPYLMAVSYMSVVSWTFFGFLTLLALPVTRVLYGDQWDDAVLAAQILCFAFMIQSVISFAGPGLMSLGMIKYTFFIQLIVQTPRVILTVIASFYSIEHVALVQVLFYFYCLVIYHLILHKRLDISVADLFRNTSKSFVIAFIANLIPFAIVYTSFFDNHFIMVLSAGIGCLMGFVLGIYITHHPLSLEINALKDKLFFFVKGIKNES